MKSMQNLLAILLKLISLSSFSSSILFPVSTKLLNSSINLNNNKSPFSFIVNLLLSSLLILPVNLSNISNRR